MKNVFILLAAGASLCMAGLFSSCSKSTIQNNEDPELVKITEGYAAGAATRVAVYTTAPVLTAGYTRFYIALYDSVSGSRVQNAAIRLAPLMDMGSMQHAAPFEDPSSDNAVNNLFPCSVVFTMPSTAGNWTVSITVKNNRTGKQGALTVPLTVAEPAKPRVRSFKAQHDGATYIISLIDPLTPKVGMNDLEIAVYKKASMMSFLPDSSLTISFSPEMPAMGHGSPNNVDPVAIGNGHYKGTVNFTMTGLWRLNLLLQAEEQTAEDTQYFEIEF